MERVSYCSPVILEWRRRLEDRFGSGPFTTHAAQGSGIGPSRLSRLLSSCLIVKVAQGVYRLREPPSEVLERARHAALAIPGAVVGRRTSAWLYGEDARSPDEQFEELPIECLVQRGRVPVRRPGIRCYQADLLPHDIAQIDGIRCTTPARTAADLLRWVPSHMALACVDQMARTEIVTPEAIFDVLSRWPGERNVRRARRLASFLEPRCESYGESWLRLRLLDAGFPPPEAQIPIHDTNDREVYRLDLGWRKRRLAIEYDGEEFHAGPHQAEADARRRDDLHSRFGWRVVGVGRAEVLGLSLALENGVGELLGLQPVIRRRAW